MEQEFNIDEQLKANINFLKWYFNTKIDIRTDKEKEKLFNILATAYLEDVYCFVRIYLYIANTRTTDLQELKFKSIIHFMCIIEPELCIANLNLFITAGYKKDILFYVSSVISGRVLPFIKHKAYEGDEFFKELMEGKILDEVKENKITYKLLNRKNKWSILIDKILDEPLFNGITVKN